MLLYGGKNSISSLLSVKGNITYDENKNIKEVNIPIMQDLRDIIDSSFRQKFIITPFLNKFEIVFFNKDNIHYEHKFSLDNDKNLFVDDLISIFVDETQIKTSNKLLATLNKPESIDYFLNKSEMLNDFFKHQQTVLNTDSIYIQNYYNKEKFTKRKPKYSFFSSKLNIESKNINDISFFLSFLLEQPDKHILSDFNTIDFKNLSEEKVKYVLNNYETRGKIKRVMLYPMFHDTPIQSYGFKTYLDVNLDEVKDELFKFVDECSYIIKDKEQNNGNINR